METAPNVLSKSSGGSASGGTTAEDIVNNAHGLKNPADKHAKRTSIHIRTYIACPGNLRN
ncbi:hypothetical protein PHLCEN_2v8437 [Hermanssonia centrifuga]|uniref:Uncharacterized protein n=1 Tax=Hermanssonia centrifuga TaxID=98765 RepID=A0A2R6NTM1_9APHY|nr:hypothetical protein PHLCEN_2v8437 [Hermanssonia centrifuga]